MKLDLAASLWALAADLLAPSPSPTSTEGIGMFGGFSVPGPLAKLAPAEVEGVADKAEVWFQRV
jgi:hypothetical protein